MGLMEQLEEDKAKLEELSQEENQEDIVEEDEPEAVEEPVEEEPVDDVEENPKTKEGEPSAEEEVRHNEYYKTRRELAAAKKRLAELEARDTAPQEEAIDGGIDHELEEVRQEMRVKKAEREFSGMEQSFAAHVSDYEAVSNQYKQSVYQAQRVLDPRASHADLLDRTRMAILQRAGQYINEGFDPIAEMYNEAKQLGFGQQQEAVPNEDEEQKPRVSHDKLKANRQRSAGTAGAKGSSGGGELTLQSAASMSVGEWSKLSPAEKRRLTGGGQ